MYEYEPDQVSPVDQMNALLDLGDRLFARPELDWTPEARIAFRENSNLKAIADLTGKVHRPLGMQQIRERVCARRGEEAWRKLLQREAQRLRAERWQHRQ